MSGYGVYRDESEGTKTQAMEVLIIAVVIFALVFEFINGFHDTANAIATSVYTRALSVGAAIALASGMNFVGALMFEGVAKTISSATTTPARISGAKPVDS